MQFLIDSFGTSKKCGSGVESDDVQKSHAMLLEGSQLKRDWVSIRAYLVTRFGLLYDKVMAKAEQSARSASGSASAKTPKLIPKPPAKSDIPSADIINDFLHSPGAATWPEMAKLARICLTIPVSNAQTERSFSIMKIVKTARRSTMTDTMLDALMRIKTNGPDDIHKVPFEQMVLWWYKSGKRRVTWQLGIFKDTSSLK
jgi:hypothetical protein